MSETDTEKPQPQSPWTAAILTLFPDMFPGPLGVSVTGNALEVGLWTLQTHDIRDHGIGRHRTVDDTPAGGGAGMVLRADVVANAIDTARQRYDRTLPAIYLSPRGEPLTDMLASELSRGPGVMLVSGRFEGLDQRAIDTRGLREVSIGDYVLSGGELAAMVLLDACVRKLPGVIGSTESLTEESFANGLLEYPQYTRPRDFEGHTIPDVLLSGDHKKIEEWRRTESEKLTRQRRPDLFKNEG